MKYANNIFYTVFVLGLTITSHKISAGKEFEMPDANQSVSNTTQAEIQRRIEEIKADQYYQNSRSSHFEQTLQERDQIIQHLVRTKGHLPNDQIMMQAEREASTNEALRKAKRDTLPLGLPEPIEWESSFKKASNLQQPAEPKSTWQKVIDWVKKKLPTKKTNGPESTLQNLDTKRQGYITHAQDVQKIYDRLTEPKIIVPIEDASRNNPKSFGYETIDLEPIQDALNELLINKNDLESSASILTGSNGYDDAITELASQLKKNQKLKLSTAEIAHQLQQYLDFKSLDFRGKQRFLDQLQKQFIKKYEEITKIHQDDTKKIGQDDPDALTSLNEEFTKQTEELREKIYQFIDSFKPLCEKNQVILHTLDRRTHNVIINLVDFNKVQFNPDTQTPQSAINTLIKNQHLEVPQDTQSNKQFKNELLENIIKYSSTKSIDTSKAQNKITQDGSA